MVRKRGTAVRKRCPKSPAPRGTRAHGLNLHTLSRVGRWREFRLFPNEKGTRRNGRMPFLQSGYQGGALTVVERVLSVPLNLCIERQLLRRVATDPRRRAPARELEVP